MKKQFVPSEAATALAEQLASRLATVGKSELWVGRRLLAISETWSPKDFRWLLGTTGRAPTTVRRYMKAAKIVKAHAIDQALAERIGPQKLCIVEARLGQGEDALWLDKACSMTAIELRRKVHPSNGPKSYRYTIEFEADDPQHTQLRAELMSNGYQPRSRRGNRLAQAFVRMAVFSKQARLDDLSAKASK